HPRTARARDRPMAALTSRDLLPLNGQPPADTELVNTHLAEPLQPGQDVFVEMDRYQQYNGSGFSGSIPAKVVEVQHSESSYDADQLILQSTDGDQLTVYAHHTDYSVVPTSRQVSLHELLPTAQVHPEPEPTI